MAKYANLNGVFNIPDMLLLSAPPKFIQFIHVKMWILCTTNDIACEIRIPSHCRCQWWPHAILRLSTAAPSFRANYPSSKFCKVHSLLLLIASYSISSLRTDHQYYHCLWCARPLPQISLSTFPFIFRSFLAQFTSNSIQWKWVVRLIWLDSIFQCCCERCV